MRNMKVIVALIAITVLTFGGAIGSFAANPTETSTATVVFQPFSDWDQMVVTRPGPDTVPGPEHDPRPPISTPGPFMLAWVPTFDFDIHQMGSFPLITLPAAEGGGVVATFDVLRDPVNPADRHHHFVNVWDYRNFITGPGSNGWHVRVQMMTPFREFNPATGNLVVGGHVLNGARIHLRRPAGAPNNVTGFSLDGTTVMASATDTVNTPAGNLPEKYTASNRWLELGGTVAAPLPGPPVNIAASRATTGMGSTAINLGHGADVQLQVPSSSIQVGRYVADLQWTLTAGPGWLVP